MEINGQQSRQFVVVKSWHTLLVLLGMAAAITFLLLPVSASARSRIQGNCEQGGNQVLVANGAAASTTAAGVRTNWQQSFASCTVTVFLTATAGGVESAPSNSVLAPVPSFAVTQLQVVVQ